MRRLVILALLLAGMQLILPLGARGHGGQWLLTFGFLILAADTVGQLAPLARLPKLVGYLAAGVVFGPSVLALVTDEATRQLAPVSSLAIALIAFLAGAELRWSELRRNGTTIVKILVSEMSLTLLAVTGLLLLMRAWVPFLQGTEGAALIALALLFGSVAVVHSPAVTMALLSETGARGPVARTTLGVVLLSDLAVILLFSGVLAIARRAMPATGAPGPSLGMLTWEIAGALVVGAALGAGVAAYLRVARRELFLLAMLVAFFGAELARLAHVESLLTLLTAGFVAENLSEPSAGEALRDAMERSAAPVFVVFFALAGASMELGAIATLWPLVVPIVVVRALAMWSGSAIGCRWARATPVESRHVWMGLVSQAGVAIGLAAIVAEAYPERGTQMQSLFLTVMAVNQTVGPILFRRALERAGEMGSESEEAAPLARGAEPREPAAEPA